MSIKDLRRQWKGSIAHAQGKQFEQRLDVAFTYYRTRGLADIQKTPEPMRVVKNLGNGKFEAFFEKKAQADYSGVLAGGEAITFEAKYTSTDRLGQCRVTAGQGEFLERRDKLGSLCYVLAGFASGRIYRIPWNIWRDMKDIFGRQYVTEDNLGGWRIPTVDGVLQILWKL